MTPKLIQVTGPPGSGKTTLTRVLAPKLRAHQLLSDQTVAASPFLSDFHADPKRWAFHNQAWCLVHFARLFDRDRSCGCGGKDTAHTVISDCGISEVLLYCEAMAAIGFLSVNEHQILKELWGWRDRTFVSPDLTIYLSVPDATILESRIRKRGREIEKAMSAELINELWMRFGEWHRVHTKTALLINAHEHDFREARTCDHIAAQVSRRLTTAF